MSDMKQFKLPDVGEGLTEAEIVTWKVKAGDTVKVNDVDRRDRDREVAGRAAVPVRRHGGRAVGRRGRDGRRRARRSSRSRPAMPRRHRPRRTGRARGRQPRRGPGADAQGRRGRRARADRRPRSRRPHLGAGRLRPTHDRGEAPPAQGRRRPSVSSPAAAQAGVQHAFTPHATPAARRSTSPMRHRPTRRPVPSRLDDRRGRRTTSRCWPSRRCASSPRTSASTSRRHRRPAPGGTITRDDVQDLRVRHDAAAGGAAAVAPRARPPASARRGSRSRACAR